MDRKEIRDIFQKRSRRYPPMTLHAKQLKIKKASYQEYTSFLEEELIKLHNNTKVTVTIEDSKLVSHLKNKNDELR